MVGPFTNKADHGATVRGVLPYGEDDEGACQQTCSYHVTG